jgi:DNA-binding NarL/FixJ family response regulator
MTEAREALYRAIDMAVDMGMERLSGHVYDELVLAGGRPRRTRTSGPRSLTAAQQQVASMAADGLTNRQIAEALFVTIKTVETHLAAVYRKLGISSRDELADQLATEEGSPRTTSAPAMS